MSPRPAVPASPDPAAPWPGPFIRYDLVKELAVALAAIAALTVALAILFSSPDLAPVTLQSWARADPRGFLATAATELDRSSDLATYGPPYNNATGAVQKIGPVSLQEAVGVHVPIDTARDFVLEPLRSVPADPQLRASLAAYEAAPPARQAAWAHAYEKGLEAARLEGGAVRLPPGRYGPVAPMLASLLDLARSGGLDGDLLAGSHRFYQTDYTRPLLFLAGGEYFERRASEQHLLGTQWGMMNETGRFPGQVWLWLYTFWYQIEPFTSSPNADALILVVMLLLSLIFVCVPFVPGLRSLPRRLGVHRVIWRDHYREAER